MMSARSKTSSRFLSLALMAPSALQARIAAFEALQNGDSSLLEPSSPTTSDSKDSEWVLEPPQPSPTIMVPRTSPPRKRPTPSPPAQPASAPPLPPRQATLELPVLGHKRGQSSVSSMHSVSLSSDQGDDEQHVQTYPLDTDKDSLAESYEDVTVPASYREHAPISTPYSYSQRRVPPPPSPIPVPLPPPLPQRQVSAPAIPAARTSPNTTGSSSMSSASRRVPPPPPPSGPLPYVARTRTPSTSRPPSVRSFGSNSSAPPVPIPIPIPSFPPSRTASVSSTSTANNHHHTTITIPRVSPALIVQQGTGSSGVNLTGYTRGRAPPMPPAARARYDRVFDANWRAVASRKNGKKEGAGNGNGMLSVPGAETPRTRKGWRGLSVDLIPADNPALAGEGGGDEKVMTREKVEEKEEVVPGDARLPSGVVKRIWSLSRLEKTRLKDIWYVWPPPGYCFSYYHLIKCRDSVSDPAKPAEGRQGGLTRDAFARGMWAIDDDLRRARIGALAGKRRQSAR